MIAPISRASEETQNAATTKSDQHYSYIVLAAGPILANILLVVGLHLPASISMGIVVAVMAIILKQLVL